MLNLSKVTLEISRNNFLFKSSSLWNNILENIFQKTTASESGIIINGATTNQIFVQMSPLLRIN